MARERHDLHENTSPGKYHWVGARKHGQWWNYVVLMDETRVELHIDGPEASDNKAAFDALAADRAAELLWQRLDEKRASRVSFTVPGGWADETTWPGAIEEAVDAMHRLYGALASRVAALHE